MDTLDAVASSLDRFESLRPRLPRLGRLHASYGVLPADYDTLITALLWAFGQALGADFDARTREAWRLALERRCRRHARGCCDSRMIDSIVILRPWWMKGGVG